MYKFLFVLALVIAGMQLPAAGQDLSHKGRSFWIAYPDPVQSVRMVLYFGAGNRAATVTITAAWETGSSQKVYNVPANKVIASDLMPQNIVLADIAVREKTFARSIHIESDVPIVAYAHYYNSEYSGSTLLIPEETWGYAYQAMDSPDDNNGFICVIASHDNTRVEITPVVTTSLGKPANTPFTVNINKGQVYQFLSGSGELTGSKIRAVSNAAGACYPVSVLSGSLGAPICGMTSDFIINQLLPNQSWGRRFVTAPFSTSLSNGNSFNTGIYRVQVSNPATTVKVNGTPLTGLTNGLFYEFRSNTADYIEADQPVMVVQFMGSQAVQGGNCQFYGVGDPEMISLSPLEQATSRSDFYLPYQGDILYNYLTLVIPNKGLPSLTINGSSTFSYVFAHPNLPGYTVVVNRWIAAGKSCTVQSDSAFTGITYGLAPWNTYGFNITSLKNLTGMVELSNKPDAGLLKDSTCAGMPCKLVFKTGDQPTRIEWQLGNIPGLSPNANVVLNNPVPDSTVVEYGHVYYIYSTPLYYTFNTPGIVTVPVQVTMSSIDNCDHTQTYTGYLKVNASPVAAFGFSPSVICMPDGKAVFTNQTSYPDAGAALQYQWDFGDGVGSVQANPVHYYTSPAVVPVSLAVSSPNGCSDTALGRISIYTVPAVDAGPDMTVQEGSGVTLQATADAAVPVQWSPAVYLDNAKTLTPVASPPASQLYYITATANQCSGRDSVWVKVIPRPDPDINIPNAFSPNGDGINDVWEITGLSSYATATLQVFNRWGQKVFESTGYTRPWDGRLNGRPLPVGTYYYVVEPGHKKPRQSGAVTILR